MTQETEKIGIPNKDNEMLVGELHKADSHDLIILCHGLGWDKDHELYKEICESIQKKKVNAFRFNFSGYEPSEGKKESLSYMKQAKDLDAVVNLFVRDYHIKSIIGHSTGATAAILQAAKNSKYNCIDSLILIAPRINPSNSIIVKTIIEQNKTISEIINSPNTKYPFLVSIKGKQEKVYELNRDYLKELNEIDILGYLCKIKIPIFIFRGTNDKRVTSDEIEVVILAKKLAKHIPIKNAGHTFKNEKDKKKLKKEILKLIVVKHKGGFILGYFTLFLILSIWGMKIVKKPFLGTSGRSVEITIVILALMSTLTLSYVQLINNLGKYLSNHRNKVHSWYKAKWRKTLLSYATLMFFITILFLLARLVLLSYKTFGFYKWQKGFEFIDCGIFVSFVLGILMRIHVFLDSYLDDIKEISQHLWYKKF